MEAKNENVITLNRKDFGVSSPSTPLKVGELVTVVVKVYGGVQEEEPMLKVMEEVVMEVSNSCHDEIYSVKELRAPVADEKDMNSNCEVWCILFKFSVRRSGIYQIKIFHRRVMIEGSPVKLKFVASEIDAGKTTFLRESYFMTIGNYYVHEFDVQPRDKYDNNCKLMHIQLTNFDMKLLKTSAIFKDDDDVPVEGALIEAVKGRGDRVRFKVKVSKPGIYRGKVTYKGKRIHNGEFMLLVVSREENACFHSIMSSNLSHWPKFEARLLVVGSDHVKAMRRVYIHVCAGQIEIGEYFLRLIPLKLATFRVSSITKVKLEYTSADDATYCLTFSDRMQTPVTVEMKAVTARVMLSLYSYHLRRKIGGSETFDGKQRVLHRFLRDMHEDGRYTRRVLRISRNDIIDSTTRQTRGFVARDWCKNFRIEFKHERGIDGGGLRKEWLNKLCKLFFSGEDATGMFALMGDSHLVHPVDACKRNSRWRVQHYRLAGLIVGKCIFETAHGDAFRQMANARFSRSFLAQILGVTPNYGYFEDDDHELYKTKVKYILNNDIAELGLTFVDEEYNSKGKLVKVVDLVPNGSKISVTENNKEDYLNAMAKYRLVTKVQKEVDSFLKGLHEIVPADLLCNFEEKELELLMCGKHEFDVDDLRSHSTAASWQFDGNTTKLLEWFWTAVAKMTESERGKLLEFVTGSALLPPGGFKSLYPQFNIEFSPRKVGSLPTAVTCVNRISLADHCSFDSFEHALKLAIEEGNEGFGFG